MSSVEGDPHGTLPRGIGSLAALTLAGCAPATAISAGDMVNAPPAIVEASFMFDGVTVVDVEQGTLVPDQRVAISGNHIAAVGSPSTVKVSRDAKVVDARGKYLIPGLWDMHTHSNRMADVFYPLFIANGVTGIRDASSSMPLDTLIQWRREILAGTRVGPPRQLLSGPAIDEDNRCVRRQGSSHTCVTVGDTADIQQLVDSLKAAGADMLKTYHLSRETFFAIARAARRVGIPFGGHDTATTAIEAADSGAGMLDHVNAAGDLHLRCLADTAIVTECRLVAEQLWRHNTWWVPTVMVEVVFGPEHHHPPARQAPRTTSATDTIAKHFMFDFRRVFASDSVLRRYPFDTASMLAMRAVSHADSLGILRFFPQVGLPILAGTDANTGGKVLSGFALHAELAIYVAEGLTPAEALRTATLNPARYLHATDSLGTVAPGKLADLVLLDADPLADITNTTTIRAVVANGRYFNRTMLDSLLVKARSHGPKKKGR